MRRQRSAVLWATSLAALLGLTIFTFPAEAQAGVGLFGGVYEPEEGDQLDVWGISGDYRIRPSFGLEANLGSLNFPDSFASCPPGTFCAAGSSLALVAAPIEVDVYTLDLSATWHPRGGDAVLFAGPGLALFDYTAKGGSEPVGFESREEIATVHAGVGYEWKAGGRLLVRPELRGRHYFAESLGTGLILEQDPRTDVMLTVTLGYRLKG